MMTPQLAQIRFSPRAQMLDSDTSDNPPFDEDPVGKCVGFAGSRARARVRARGAANFGNFGHPDTRGTVKFVKFPFGKSNNALYSTPPRQLS
jgi:hypothetical protein